MVFDDSLRTLGDATRPIFGLLWHVPARYYLYIGGEVQAWEVQ